jgi:hypothetical protein
VVGSRGEQCSFRSVTVVPLGNASSSSSGGGLTAEDVLEHVQEKVEWVDPLVHPWSCVDGRAAQPGLTTPAGDSGEFILGLAVYHLLLPGHAQRVRVSLTRRVCVV